VNRSQAAAAAGIGGVLFAGATAIARAEAVHGVERDVFRTVNDLPDALHPPVYVAMQAGSLAGAWVAAGGAWVAGRSQVARTLAAAGTGVWAGAKLVKRGIGRGRPTLHVEGVQIRGSEERGLGYPSGHTAVAFCVAAIGDAEVPPAARPSVWALATTVGLARMYVGAHLPLDVVGGAALGLTVGALASRARVARG
jgi:membrane-associated phospholipid phosphatase